MEKYIGAGICTIAGAWIVVLAYGLGLRAVWLLVLIGLVGALCGLFGYCLTAMAGRAK